MSVNPQTSDYLNWHNADTGNGNDVENAFCMNGNQLDLVFGVGEEDLLHWSLHIGYQFIDAT